MLRLLDKVLGTETNVRMLRAILPLESPVTGREAQRLAGIRSRGSTQRALEDLTGMSLLERTEAGAARLYRKNVRNELLAPLAALFAAEAAVLPMVRDELARVLDAANLETELLTVMIFGSHARGEGTPQSDLDVLLVTRTEGAVDAVNRAVRRAAPALMGRFGLNLSPYVVSRADASLRMRSGDPFITAVVEEGRMLAGSDLEDVLR